jgi:dTDP-4-amino-4,6-dideoxy-D-galactose acyltransferase
MSSPSPNTIVPLPWDSELLGFPVAAINARNLAEAALYPLVAAASAQGIRLLYLFVPPGQDKVTAVLGPAAGPAYANLTLHWQRLEEPLVSSVSPFIQPAPTLTADLEELALQSGAWSRFRRDPRLAPTVFPSLYRRWLHRAFTAPGYEVLQYQALSQPIQGLLTLATAARHTIVDLLAVDAGARGQGLGRQLLEAARQRALQQGHAEIQVTTQLDNAGACRFYESCGFGPGSVTNIYHLWLDHLAMPG